MYNGYNAPGGGCGGKARWWLLVRPAFPLRVRRRWHACRLCSLRVLLELFVYDDVVPVCFGAFGLVTSIGDAWKCEGCWHVGSAVSLDLDFGFFHWSDDGPVLCLVVHKC